MVALLIQYPTTDSEDEDAKHKTCQWSVCYGIKYQPDQLSRLMIDF
ncbi:hypothetical protein [Secundilactobacillus similis]|nr:hypothetical protein [Secundilactobacillus similis]